MVLDMQANGSRIRALRLARGETLEQFAVRIGIGYETLATIERGTTMRPRRLTLTAIAGGLGVSIAEITVQDQAIPA